MNSTTHSLTTLLALSGLTSIGQAQNLDWLQPRSSAHDDVARAAASDGSGGVFLIGETSYDWNNPGPGYIGPWAERYDAGGALVWRRAFGSGTPAAELATAAAPDGGGGVYMVGFASGNFMGPGAGGLDAWVALYSGAGNQLWGSQLGTVSEEKAWGAASDGAGGVFLCGSTLGALGGANAGGSDAWCARYGATGDLLWTDQVGSSGKDEARCAAADGSGGVYVAGFTSGDLGGPNAGGRDAWVAHYDSSGARTWLLQLGSVGTDEAYGAAPDGAGGVYVGGVTDGSLGGPGVGQDDAWLVHLDGAGNQQWIRQFGTNQWDRVSAAVEDGAGGVYLSGGTGGSLDLPQGHAFGDAWIAQFDASGEQLWVRQLGTAEPDYAFAVAADGEGAVFLGGYSMGSLGGSSAGGYFDAWLARYTADLGVTYCGPAVTNSTGAPGILTAEGSDRALEDNVRLVSSQLPAHQVGYFLNSTVAGASSPPGSQGTLCLGGAIGRYSAYAFDSGADGAGALELVLPNTPTPFGAVAVQPGETWKFQAWYRDMNPGATSNFTNGISIHFR